MICNLADFIIEFKNVSPIAEKFFYKFLSIQEPEFIFKITDYDIECESLRVNGKYPIENSEISAMLRKFAYWMLDNDAFLLHSALIDVNSTGVAFAAPSGTGKTTHMKLWKQLLGDSVTVINGDKPIVRFFENEPYPIGYGTPWCGKERYGINGKVAIKHFCFIERSETNSCEKLNASDILQLFFRQILIPIRNPVAVSKTLKLANIFLNNVTVWKIKCNMDISAAEVAYNTIFKENNDET